MWGIDDDDVDDDVDDGCGGNGNGCMHVLSYSHDQLISFIILSLSLFIILSLSLVIHSARCWHTMQSMQHLQDTQG